MKSCKSVLKLLLVLSLTFAMAMPAIAGDRPIDPKRDLQGISPKRHRYIFAVLGGAAAGAGLGAILGSGNDLTKGALLGGGAISSLYLSSHRHAGGSYRDWAYIFSHTALGTGIGWTLCGCNDGAVGGALIGGGATAAWRAFNPERNPRTSTTNPQP